MTATSKVYEIRTQYAECDLLNLRWARARKQPTDEASTWVIVCRWNFRLHERETHIHGRNQDGGITPASMSRITRVIPLLWQNKETVRDAQKANSDVPNVLEALQPIGQMLLPIDA